MLPTDSETEDVDEFVENGLGFRKQSAAMKFFYKLTSEVLESLENEKWFQITNGCICPRQVCSYEAPNSQNCKNQILLWGQNDIFSITEVFTVGMPSP